MADPTVEQIQKAGTKLIQQAVKPLCRTETPGDNPGAAAYEADQIIDRLAPTKSSRPVFDAEALDKAKGLVHVLRAVHQRPKDEITALQMLYSMPYKQRLRYEDIKDLASRIEKPPHQWRVDNLWNAYAALEKSKVKGASAPHILTDLVSLVRFAMHRDDELVPFPERVNANFEKWLAQTIRHSRESGNPEPFTQQQVRWLEMISRSCCRESEH